MKKQILLIASLSFLSAVPAHAEIVWQQPEKGVTTRHQRHENLEFAGNAALTRGDAMKLQRALAKKGYYHGRIDGIWGPATSQAILDWQGATQQPLTGTVNAGTLRDLGVRVAEGKYK